MPQFELILIMNCQPELVEGGLQYTGFDKLNLTTFQTETLR
jgi:hypothetical protein